MESLLWGAALRFFQALVQATPTILVGLVVAGVFRRLLGHAGTRRFFGDNTWRSLPQAWLVGMLLPVCSLGVIPVVREMRRAGVSGGAILAFGLTAPLFNPISVLYGLTLADPLVILTFSFCSLVIVTVVGIAWDRLFPHTAQPEPEPPRVAYGVRRMLSIAVFGARELAGPTSGYIGAGLLGVALLSLLLPAGYLQTAAEHDDPWAPLFMTAVAIPAYAAPMTAMVQLASMFQHGNSVGAAFTLLVLGAGANLGLVAWMVGAYGVRRTGIWFALLTGIVVGLAYGVDGPLYPHGVEPAGHTHAFDIYCAPFAPSTPQVMQKTFRILQEKIAPHETVAMIVLTALILAGIGLARCDRQHRVEAWLEQRPADSPRLDVVLPGPVLGGVALLSLIAFSVLGCYIYYPSPAEVFEEMQIVNAEVVSSASSKDWDTALYWIPIYDDWTRKLQVSMFLRGESLTPYRRAKALVLREKLELLEHAVEDQEIEPARRLGLAVNRAYRRMRDACAP
ncbi:permease [Lignipirellula cremea]|uniref:Putative permease n=1 Tax=Lignipirellula cremea TaxID=2528010 RepID=A0A518E421_9BACT|nr:permease [Lignipirellula cremea]QDU98846.1 putative permease [Lignipirellula cremea]